MIDLFDIVRLKADHPELGLTAGQMGTVVDLHGGDAFEVEFADGDGRSIAVAAFDSSDVVSETPGTKKTTTFEVYRSKNGNYRWRLKLGGEVVANSESFAGKAECLQSIRTLKTQLRGAPVLDSTAA